MKIKSAIKDLYNCDFDTYGLVSIRQIVSIGKPFLADERVVTLLNRETQRMEEEILAEAIGA